MEPEEKYLDQLFEMAREEESQTSLETVSENFLSATAPSGLAFVKELLLKNINLNSVLLMSIGTLSIFGIWLMSSTPISENSSSTVVTSSLSQSSIKKEVTNTIEKSDLAILNKNQVVTFPNKEKNDAQKVNPKNNSTTLIKKQRVALSPKISTAPLNLEKDRKHIIPRITIESLTKIEKPEPRKIPNRVKNTTHTSPWVASGSGGATHIDWTIQQSNHVNNVTKSQRVLQTFMNAEYLETILEKDDNGKFLPVSIVCNYYFEEMIYLEFNNKQIEISNLNLEGISSFINVTKFRVKKRKAYLNFEYKDEIVKMQLKKVNRIWKLHKLKAKNNSGKNIDIVF